MHSFFFRSFFRGKSSQLECFGRQKVQSGRGFFFLSKFIITIFKFEKPAQKKSIEKIGFFK